MDVLSIQNGQFVDQHGRVALLRGVNLGGSSKLPFGYGHTDDQDMRDFFDGAATVSFIGRPFPLAEADMHLSRLQRWGFTLLRLIVTWEAIEHAGPNLIDYDYLDYIYAVVKKAAEYNMHVYIDPHQDVWSRWTGGDGAPMWTLECVGFEPRHFEPTKAAYCLETCGCIPSEAPKMMWPTNYAKLACATMFTLFWGGHKFAPKCCVNGVPVQEYLQSHYLASMMALAEKLKKLPNVVGFGTMNEPSQGFIGVKDLKKNVGSFHSGYAPTPFQGMALGEGIPQDVEVWDVGLYSLLRNKPSKVETIDPKRFRAWQEHCDCVWRNAGVWEIDANGSPHLVQPDYFANVNFSQDFYVPFATRFAEHLHEIIPAAMVFIEVPPLGFSDTCFPHIQAIPHAVNAMHWYDAVTLVTTTWRSYFTVDHWTRKLAFGNKALRRVHQRQLAHIASLGQTYMAHAPTLIGETGIPFNLNHARAYISGDYSAQIEAMDNTIATLESQVVSYVLWNYTADNSHAFGDLWNREDCSLSSRDSEALAIRLQSRDGSARGLKAFARPSARKIAGQPLLSTFTMATKEYVLEYVAHDIKAAALTEIYVPYVHYPSGYRITTSDGHCTVEKHESYDIVLYTHDTKVRTHRVCIVPRTLNSSTLQHVNAPLYLALAVTAVVVPLLTLSKRS
ncbi:hypothetical protein CCR75_006741 [Bremia lactucae]|uniref:Uncharacterized protein n=1 Tax=Bremia lactucae TaxID=4779 RepID=A0A976FKK8_BRELC|nr:hypothetical protein CCR75_006741 [Bremia lactucae]